MDRRLRQFALPSFPDLLFASLLTAVFGRSAGLETLLADGDTGWHIRTGEWILRARRVPHHDLFSFSRSGAPWTAWEWLSDVVFAQLYRWHGLTAVAGACAMVLCLAAACLCAWLLARGVGLWLALAVTFAATSISTVHYLARPHVFSILLFTVCLWILDRDRSEHGRAVWWLAPLTALWCNLHGGFTLWIAALLLRVMASALERDRCACRRYARLAAVCSAATLINPYGWNLHRHIAEYLASPWILNHVQEFQPPSIRSENLLVFAVALVLGTALAARRVARGQWFGPLLLWALALAALRSARHVPLFAVAAAPVIADECAALWRSFALSRGRRAPVRIFWDSGQDLCRRGAVTPWAAVLGALVFALRIAPVRDFPAVSFPVAAITASEPLLTAFPGTPRILTSDQWGDYLIFRLYPHQRVFFDGRSDFYGEALGNDYQALLDAGPRARELLERYGFDLALLPHDWALERVLENDGGWQRIYRDNVASVFQRLKNRSDPPIDNCMDPMASIRAADARERK
jgi:hypothetical protein